MKRAMTGRNRINDMCGPNARFQGRLRFLGVPFVSVAAPVSVVVTHHQSCFNANIIEEKGFHQHGTDGERPISVGLNADGFPIWQG